MRPPVLRRPIIPCRPRAIAALLPLVIGIGAEGYVRLESGRLFEHYQRIDRQAQAVEITDARGRWMGIVPRAIEPHAAPEIRLDTPPRHRVAALTEVPPGWLRVLVALEDRHLESWRSWHGLDLVALTRAAVLGPLGLSKAGGSSLAMQLVRAMNDLNPARDRRPIDRYRRKWLEVRHAPLLHEALGGLEGDRFSRLLARHLPLVQGAPGSRMGPVLHGIGLAARVLFDKAPADLDLAEQAVLAAAVRRHVMLTPHDHPRALAEAETRWTEVVKRAALGLRIAFGADDSRAEEAAGRLHAMRLPQPQLPPRLMAGAGSSAFAVAANPERRAATFLAGELSSLMGEILNRFGRSYRGRLTRVRLSLDAAENGAFKQVLRAKLADLEGRLAEKLELRLVEGRGAGPRAQVLVVAMDDHGRVIRHFTNSQDTLLNGSFRHRGRDLVFRRHSADRQVGSLAKIPIAVELGRSDAPEQAYCNAVVDGGAIHNADGDQGVPDCRAPGAWYPARTVFARSLNLPLLWRLRSVPDASLAELAERMHLRLPPNVEARAALTLGLASAVPADLLAMMQAVARGATERPAVGARPRLVREWSIVNGWHHPPGLAIGTDLRADFTPSVAAFVRSMLTAPLEAGGTLASLGGTSDHPRLHLAKSGTTGTSDGALRDKWVLGALVGSNGTISYLALVGTGDPRRPLGYGISGNDLTPLIRSLISELGGQL